jgi:hypothetical protein
MSCDLLMRWAMLSSTAGRSADTVKLWLRSIHRSGLKQLENPLAFDFEPISGQRAVPGMENRPEHTITEATHPLKSP